MVGTKRLMRMAPVESSCVAAAGYDGTRHVLRIRFVEGRTYDYLGVPEPVFEGFQAADSKGRYVNCVVKPHYAVRRAR